jgi:hypothetical protein
VPPIAAKVAEFQVAQTKPTQSVQMKLTATERMILNRLVDNHWYESRSAAMRAGLGLLFEKHGLTKAEETQIEHERRMHAPRKNFYK